MDRVRHWHCRRTDHGEVPSGRTFRMHAVLDQKSRHKFYCIVMVCDHAASQCCIHFQRMSFCTKEVHCRACPKNRPETNGGGGQKRRRRCAWFTADAETLASATMNRSAMPVSITLLMMLSKSPASERLAPTAFSRHPPAYSFGRRAHLDAIFVRRLPADVCQDGGSPGTTESAARLPSPTAAG